ncbi:hypothetical protein [Nonomuraea sp. NPDC049028]|uniref:hypothetical protein n=1 Tax=Nonomuraea sp. NPDC049028 TaxID=3364348 RepID=UPI003723470A
MGASPQAQQFAQLLESVSAKSSTPGLDAGPRRRASTEPEGVTYDEVDANGVPALWCIPEGAHPGRALLHFHFGGSATPRRTPTARPPATSRRWPAPAPLSGFR